jgi:hypothetical protein
MNIQSIIDNMNASANNFEAAASFTKLDIVTSTPWCVTSADYGMAILVEYDGTRSALAPVMVEPHLCGFSCLSRSAAERVAAARNNGTEADQYKITAYRDLPELRAAYLRNMAAKLAVVAA